MALKKSSKKRAARQGDEEGSLEQLEIFNAANHRVIQAIQNIDLEKDFLITTFPCLK